MSLNGALFQLFVVTPVCQFLLTSPRVTRGDRRRGLLLAVGFLACVSLLSAYSHVKDEPPSYYSVLQVPVYASTADVRRAYKAAAVRLHPDKNPSATAAAEFTLLSAASEVLERPELRSTYDRYGAEAAAQQLKQPDSSAFATQLLINAAVYYAVWTAMTFLLCLGSDARSGRNVAWLFLFLIGVCEYQMLHNAYNPLQALLPFTPVHRQLSFLHHLYPTLVVACRLLSQFLHVDHEAVHRLMLRDILLSNRLILSVVSQMQASIDKGAVRTAAGAEVVSERGVEEADDGSGTAGLPLPARLHSQQLRMERLERQLVEAKGRSGGGGGLPQWLVPVLLLVAFQWFGGKGGA